jgi:hypothetical protein
MPQTCAFCLPGGPESLVEVRTKTPVKYTFEPVVLSGKLTVLKDDANGLYYRLTDAQVQVAARSRCGRLRAGRLHAFFSWSPSRRQTSARSPASALETVKNWRFAPARRAEDPVAAWVIVPVVFRLTSGS